MVTHVLTVIFVLEGNFLFDIPQLNIGIETS